MAAFAGTWDPQGIERAFYRPGTIALFAARGWLLGTNAVALHALSLLLLVLVAVLFASWLHALDVSAPALFAGMLVLVVHPMTAAAVAWITNQMHLLQLVLALAALALAARAHWAWLIALQAGALLVKEDSLVLPLAIAASFWALRRPVPRGWITASIVLCGVYLLVRTAALGGLGGYEPAAAEMLRNAGRAPYYALFVFPYNGGLYTAIAVLFVLVAAWWTAPGERRILLLMSGLFVLANAPLSFSSGTTRWHLIAVAIAGATAASVHALRASRWALPLAAAVGVGFAVAGWRVTNDWHPCSGPVRAHDARVETWGSAVAPAIRAALQGKRTMCPESTVLH